MLGLAWSLLLIVPLVIADVLWLVPEPVAVPGKLQMSPSDVRKTPPSIIVCIERAQMRLLGPGGGGFSSLVITKNQVT